MLPPNFLTIPQIQRERHAGSKLFHLTTLLEFLLKTYKPNVVAAEEGKEPKVGERVIACQEVFSNFKRVLTALRVRNSFAHVMQDAEYSARDHQEAVNCLIEAIGDVCSQSAISYDIKQAVYRDPDADLHARQEAEERQRKQRQQEQDAQARSLRAEQERLEKEKLQHARREKDLERKSANRISIFAGLRAVAFLAAAGAGVYFGWPKAQVWIYGSKATATVVRTQAELALRKVRLKKKQTEYGASITQAEAAWRDAEIEFKKGNYTQAEEKYRQLLGVWDGMSARIVEGMGYDELLAEVNALRLAARNAQAAQKAADAWNQAEELRRNAITVRKNGNLDEAKNLILQARQQYDAAQAAAMAQSAEAADKNNASEGGTDGQPPTTTPNGQSEPVRTSTPMPTPDSQVQSSGFSEFFQFQTR